MTTEKDAAVLKAMNAANDAGGIGWSPSRAREALRSWCYERRGRTSRKVIQELLVKAEIGALDYRHSFEAFCDIWDIRGLA